MSICFIFILSFLPFIRRVFFCPHKDLNCSRSLSTLSSAAHPVARRFLHFLTYCSCPLQLQFSFLFTMRARSLLITPIRLCLSLKHHLVVFDNRSAQLKEALLAQQYWFRETRTSTPAAVAQVVDSLDSSSIVGSLLCHIDTARRRS